MGATNICHSLYRSCCFSAYVCSRPGHEFPYHTYQCVRRGYWTASCFPDEYRVWQVSQLIKIWSNIPKCGIIVDFFTQILGRSPPLVHNDAEYSLPYAWDLGGCSRIRVSEGGRGKEIRAQSFNCFCLWWDATKLQKDYLRILSWFPCLSPSHKKLSPRRIFLWLWRDSGANSTHPPICYAILQPVFGEPADYWGSIRGSYQNPDAGG